MLDNEFSINQYPFTSSLLSSSTPSSHHLQQEKRREQYQQDSYSQVILNNYPKQNPIFFIPEIPTNLTKINTTDDSSRNARDQSNKRPPVPGYDMKTLRKQVDYLNTQIEERIETQKRLVQQNAELWSYTQQLQQANQMNIGKMKDNMSLLTSELERTFQQRNELSDKLKLAMNSKELLHKLHSDMTQLKLKLIEEDSLKAAAENSLLTAQNDYNTVQNALVQETEALKISTDQLEDIRNQIREEKNDKAADIFFWTSEVVLKSAYHRFLTAIRYQLRCSKLHDTLHSIYKTSLKSNIIKHWKEFVYEQRVVYIIHDKHRNNLKRQYFDNWKIQFATEQLCQASRKKILLSQSFKLWYHHSQELLFQKLNDFKVLQFQNKQLKRLIFHSWKKQVIFLDWNNPVYFQLELISLRHHAHRLLLAWKSVAVQSKSRNQDIGQNILLLRTSNIFQSWKSKCLKLWRNRSVLINSFFSNLKKMIQFKAMYSQSHVIGLHHYTSIIKKRYFQKWFIYLRLQNKLIMSRKNIFYLSNKCIRKNIKNSFFIFYHRTLLWKRLNSKYKIAVINSNRKICNHSIQFWNQYTEYIKKKKLLKKLQSMKQFFDHWKYYYLPQQKLESMQQQKAQLIEKMIVPKHLKTVFSIWFKKTQKVRKCSKLLLFLQEKHQYKFLQKYFIHWYRKFGQIIYWKEKVSEIEKNRLTSMYHLKLQEKADMENEYNKSSSKAQELETVLIELQEEYAQKTSLLQESRNTIKEKQSLCEMAENELKDKINEFKSVQQECDRLTQIQEMYRLSREYELSEAQSRKQESDRIIAALQSESQSLKDEVTEARLQSYLIEQHASVSLSRKHDILHQTLKSTADLETINIKKSDTILELEKKRESVSEQLKRIENRLVSVSQQGEEIVREEEKEIRQEAAEVMMLRSDAGLVSSRVKELSTLVSEQRVALSEKRIHIINKQEQKELLDLSKMTQQQSYSHLLSQSHSHHSSSLYKQSPRPQSQDSFVSATTPNTSTNNSGNRSTSTSSNNSSNASNRSNKISTANTKSSYRDNHNSDNSRSSTSSQRSTSSSSHVNGSYRTADFENNTNSGSDHSNHSSRSNDETISSSARSPISSNGKKKEQK